MRFEFFRNKYQTELLLDCFQKSDQLDIEKPTKPFFVTFYELIFITKGSGIFKLDNEIIRFQRGTVLLLPPNRWRQWQKINGPFDAVYLIFEEEFISSFFNDTLYLYRFHYFFNIDLPSYIDMQESEFENHLNKLNELKTELAELKADSHHLLRSMLYYILIKINRSYQKAYQINSDFYQTQLVLKFRKFLEKNIGQMHKVSDYASHLGISNSHLNKVLGKYFGKPCSQLIKERLLLEVKRMLLFTDKSISEISYELNFSEPSNLNRFFQKAVKMTPKDYRLQNDNS